MIIRKPYAFLIKNFKRIHIFLLLLTLFVAYKLFKVNGFVSEFMDLGTYDFYADPITNYITTPLSIALILIVIGSGALILLLRHKKKPWKVYLVPFIEYLVLYFVLGMIKSFFLSYSVDVETTDLRMSRDLLMIFMLVQLPAIAIFIMRIFGLDIKKFDFNSDLEFLELSEEDREEIEISIDFDKNTFKRAYKRLFRNLNYFYQEHKIVCRGVIVVIVGVCLFNLYQFIFVTNKSYKEGQIYNANGYSITINNSYITDKDYKGDVISKKSKFVIVDLTIKNNSSPRVVDFTNFHIKNGPNDYITTKKTYASEFQDLGETYSSVKELKRDESINVIIVYKVDSTLKNNRYVLYYQELEGKLRKIKLNLTDISEITKTENLSLGDSMTVDLYKKSDTFSFDSYEFLDSVNYKVNACASIDCNLSNNTYTVEPGYKILELLFGSNNYENKNMIDFLDKYGKIVYKDSEGISKTLDMVFPVKKSYLGKVVFLKIPAEIENTSELELVFMVRNKKYVYKLI